MTPLTSQKGETIFNYIERSLSPEDKTEILKYEINPALQAAVKKEDYETAAKLRDTIKQGELQPKGELTIALKNSIRLMCLEACNFDVTREKDSVAKELDATNIISVEMEDTGRTSKPSKTIDSFFQGALPRQVKDLIAEELSILKDNAVKNAEFEEAQYFRGQADGEHFPPESKIASRLVEMLGLVAAEKCGFNVADDMKKIIETLNKTGIHPSMILRIIKSRFPSEGQEAAL